jgi:hypothetical protein
MDPKGSSPTRSDPSAWNLGEGLTTSQHRNQHVTKSILYYIKTVDERDYQQPN